MVYVSPYEEEFNEALRKAFNKLPEKYEKLVQNITDKIGEEVQESLRNYTVEYLGESIADDITRKAEKVAESMISNALAGDDKTIRNLFGFNDYYMRNLYLGKLPTEFKLIDAIVERRPDIFIDEKITHQDAHIKALEKEVARLGLYIDQLRKKYVE